MLFRSEQVELETNIKMDTKSEIEFIGEEPISITLDDTLEIVDNLNSQSSTKALSARQGNTIKQLIDNVFTNANTSKYTKLWMGTLWKCLFCIYNSVYYAILYERMLILTLGGGTG